MFELFHSLYKRLTTSGSIEEQAVQSGIWVAGINIGTRGLQLLKVIILARLLTPNAFGLLGIALLVLVGLRRFSNLGFNEALIQHHSENVDTYLDTLWLMKIARGSFIALVAFIISPYVAIFFGEPQAEPLIQVIGAAHLLQALSNPALVYFQKDLDFHKEFTLKMCANLADFVVAVIFALIYGSVWALAVGILAMNATQMILSYILLEYRPRLEFNLEYAREMFGFGKWIFGEAVLTFLFFEADDAFVGWFFSTLALGYYQIAYRYSNAPATEITQVIRRIAFPALSTVQNDIKSLQNGFFRIVKISTVVSFPMAAGIFAIAPEFVLTVFGEQWAPMIDLMKILAIWGALRSLDGCFAPVFKAVGRPDYKAKILSLQVLIVALTIIPFANRFGIIGVGYSLIGQYIITLPLGYHITISLIKSRTYNTVLILYPLVGSIAMATTIIILKELIFQGKGLLELVILIPSGIIIYIAIMYTIDHITEYEFVSIYYDISELI